jgi:hypothetical protein
LVAQAIADNIRRAAREGLAGEDDEEAMELSMSMGLGADSQ